MSLPLVFKVDSIRQDSPNLKTYVFKHNIRAKSGQFLMVWLPGHDEVPMSIGWQTKEEFHVGIADAGDCTHAIHEKIKVGDKLGFRGPYGSSFDYKDVDHLICVGGGYGTPPMLNLAQRATELGKKVTVIQGASCSDYLLYQDLFDQLGVEILVSTGDGSKGHHGFCTDILEDYLGKIDTSQNICIYTCGPEVMMVKIAEIAKKNNLPCQVSLERYMKCGFGICGQCCMDDSGIRICKEGPVIPGQYALEHPEFGKYCRSSSGKIKE